MQAGIDFEGQLEWECDRFPLLGEGFWEVNRNGNYGDSLYWRSHDCQLKWECQGFTLLRKAFSNQTGIGMSMIPFIDVRAPESQQE